MTAWWTFVSHGIAHIFAIIAVDVSLLCSKDHCRHWTTEKKNGSSSRNLAASQKECEKGGGEWYSVKKNGRTRRMTAYVYMRKVHRISLLFLSSYCTRVWPVCWSNRSLFQLSPSSSFTDSITGKTSPAVKLLSIRTRNYPRCRLVDWRNERETEREQERKQTRLRKCGIFLVS